MTIFLIAVSIALGVSFLCSLMEAALLSLTPSQVARLSERHPATGAIWRGVKANLERPIAVILILNTTAHTIGASVAGAQFDELWGDEWIWAFSIVFTLVMLQFTEILPKTLGVQFNTLLAPVIARPLQAAVVVFPRSSRCCTRSTARSRAGAGQATRAPRRRRSTRSPRSPPWRGCRRTSARIRSA